MLGQQPLDDRPDPLALRADAAARFAHVAARHQPPQLRARADEVERGAVAADELVGRRPELVRLDPRDRLGQLGLQPRQVVDPVGAAHDRVGPLEEVVDDLDLLRPGAEAGERVDEPLQAVVVLDDLLRRALGERVRLVVEHERLRPVALEHVDPAVEQDAVVLESERQLGGRALERGDAGAELRLAVRGDETADPLELLVGHGRVAGADELGEVVGHGRRAQVDRSSSACTASPISVAARPDWPGTVPAASAGRRPTTRSAK